MQHQVFSPMPIRFVIEDQRHAEPHSEHASLADAWAEPKRLSDIPWDRAPNVAPCASWRTCGRDYHIIEYEVSSEPWPLLRRISGLEIGAKAMVWGAEAPYAGA
jgi:hypothetical protein